MSKCSKPRVLRWIEGISRTFTKGSVIDEGRSVIATDGSVIVQENLSHTTLQLDEDTYVEMRTTSVIKTYK